MARKRETTNELTLEPGKSANRRRSRRVPMRVWAENRGFEEFCLWLAAEDIRKDFAFCYRTADLSSEGVFLETTTPLVVGTEMDLSFRLPGSQRTLTVVGEVVRIQSRGDGLPPGMAVAFRRMEPEDRAHLDAFLIAKE